MSSNAVMMTVYALYFKFLLLFILQNCSVDIAKLKIANTSNSCLCMGLVFSILAERKNNQYCGYSFRGEIVTKLIWQYLPFAILLTHLARGYGEKSLLIATWKIPTPLLPHQVLFLKRLIRLKHQSGCHA